jgi:Domain of unknown function (DUF4293)
MWQRVQSIFLGVSIVALIFSIVYPVWSGGTDAIHYRLYPIYFMTKEIGLNAAPVISIYLPYCLTAVLTIASITISITEFRRYTNLVLQVKLGTLNSLILAGVMVCDVAFSNQVAKSHPVPWQYDLGLYLVFVAVVSNWLAIRFIRRDEKLLRDSDRIR